MRFVHTLYRTGVPRSAIRLHAGECIKNFNQTARMFDCGMHISQVILLDAHHQKEMIELQLVPCLPLPAVIHSTSPFYASRLVSNIFERERERESFIFDYLVDDDDDFTPGDMKSIGDCLVVNTIFLPNVTPFI